MKTSDFVRLGRLGVGSEGTIWLEQNVHTKEYFACKDKRVRVSFKVATGEEIPKEVYIRKFRMPWEHPNLLDLHGWCIIPSDPPRRCNIYYEYCAGGNLRDLIPKGHPAHHSEAFIWHVFIQLAEALDGMHNHGSQRVLHRDVKPENVFLKSQYRPNHRFPTIKLGDYGSAYCEDERANTGSDSGPMITWSYMPPEIECSAAADIWALGAVIHELCHGFSPVSEKGIHWERDPAARKPKDLPKIYSDALHWQVMSCLRSSRHDRPSAQTLVRRLHRERPSEHR